MERDTWWLWANQLRDSGFTFMFMILTKQRKLYLAKDREIINLQDRGRSYYDQGRRDSETRLGDKRIVPP